MNGNNNNNNNGYNNNRRRRRQRRRAMLFWCFLRAIAVAVALCLALAYKEILDRALVATTITTIPTTTTTTTTTIATSSRSRSNSNSNSNSNRCAILLFGLPRAFREYVLPSLTANVIVPNARYNCDYFVHYYRQDHEPPGRSGKGGILHPDDVLALRDVVLQVQAQVQAQQEVQAQVHDAEHNHHHHHHHHHRIPHVGFVSDTNETFWEARATQLHEYRTARIDRGKGGKLKKKKLLLLRNNNNNNNNNNINYNNKSNYKYFPYKEPTYVYPETMDNIVRQWHSIQAVWELMTKHATATSTTATVSGNGNGSDSGSGNIIRYDTVAMLRNDVVFLTPIDLYRYSSTNTNTNNNDNDTPPPPPPPPPPLLSPPVTAVIPGFAKYPVNDRMIYGPHDAVQIWATQRFSRISEHANQPQSEGMALHSESFLAASILPAIRRVQIIVEEEEQQQQQQRRRGQQTTQQQQQQQQIEHEKIIIQTHEEQKVQAQQEVNKNANGVNNANNANKANNAKNVNTNNNAARNKKQNVTIVQDPELCFLRVRADGAIWIEDCDSSKGVGATAGGYPGGQDAYRKLLEPFVVGKKCKKRRVQDPLKLRIIHELFCSALENE